MKDLDTSCKGRSPVYTVHSQYNRRDDNDDIDEGQAQDADASWAPVTGTYGSISIIEADSVDTDEAVEYKYSVLEQ